MALGSRLDRGPLMPSSKTKHLGMYPAGWLKAAQDALAEPERWRPFPVVMPAAAADPSPDTVHRRLRAFPAAFIAFPAAYPDITAGIKSGGEFKFRRRVELGIVQFEVCFYPHRGRAIELIEKALAGG